ncbi:hypothetical protein [Aeromonas caviae]|uniref:hypothetical protein n=1 Tax=Aeromonas caviae TaxID=648 RepID=UPI003F742B8C
MSKQDKATQATPKIDLRQRFRVPGDAATGLELYAATMSAPGIANRFSYKQMNRFLAACARVEALTLTLADPETTESLARLTVEIDELCESIKEGGACNPADQRARAFIHKVQQRSAIIRRNHVTHEREAVNTLLTEGAGKGGFGRVLAAIADGAEAALRREADAPSFDDSIPDQGGDQR